MLVDAGFGFAGFRILDKKVQRVGKRRWVKTNHDLDRLIERDGIRYGVEVKNQLGYIDQTEFQTKMKMCEHLGVRPMFVARMLPKNYMNEIQEAGGFGLLLEQQHYPLMVEDFAREVRNELKLPVVSVRALPNTALQRFEEWHEGSLK